MRPPVDRFIGARWRSSSLLPPVVLLVRLLIEIIARL
jgi:hypothetical protein